MYTLKGCDQTAIESEATGEAYPGAG